MANCKSTLTDTVILIPNFNLINAFPLSMGPTRHNAEFGVSMSKYAQLAISLPLLALPFSTFVVKPAVAETVGIERALELLAKSTVVDAKCHILSAPERDELSRYISRAEVAAAEKTSLAVTRSSLSAGKKMGQATVCGAQASAEVKDTLSAAREAIKSVAKRESVAAAAPADMTKPENTTGQPPATTGKLSSYARITEAYFLERRCTYLSGPEIASFYKAVLKNHYAAVAQFGKPAVTAARKNAEIRATAQSCNSAGEARVNAGYAEVASR
jgi:hypothetical protein